MVTPDEIFATLKLPEGDFEERNRFITPSYPLWCHGCEAWHLFFYNVHFGRRSGRRFVEVWAPGNDGGEPDLAETWVEKDGDEKFAAIHARYFGDTFLTLMHRAWATYFDWSLEHDLEDPVGALEDRTRTAVARAYMNAMTQAQLTKRPSVN
jgi:hypothetical protein